jgi:hypothetical protein
MEKKFSKSNVEMLIRLDEKVDGILNKLKDLDGNYSIRLLNVESNALSKIEFNKVKDDHEERLRFIERYMWIAIGGLAALQIGIEILDRLHIL